MNTERLQDGVRVLQQEYYGQVHAIAQELIDACRSGEIADEDAFSDRLHEECDGADCIIYTFQARCVLLASDNSDAALDECGADSFDWTNGPPWEQLAYYALREDVMQRIHAEEGFDASDASTWREDEPETADAE